MQQQGRAGYQRRAHGFGASGVLAVFCGQFSFLGQQAAQQSGGEHTQGQQRYDCSPTGKRLQIAAVKFQCFGHQIRQRRGKHYAPGEACTGGKHSFAGFCQRGQCTAQTC